VKSTLEALKSTPEAPKSIPEAPKSIPEAPEGPKGHNLVKNDAKGVSKWRCF